MCLNERRLSRILSLLNASGGPTLALELKAMSVLIEVCERLSGATAISLGIELAPYSVIIVAI